MLLWWLLLFSLLSSGGCDVWNLFKQLQTGIKFFNREEIIFWTLEKKFGEGMVLLWSGLLKGREGALFPGTIKIGIDLTARKSLNGGILHPVEGLRHPLWQDFIWSLYVWFHLSVIPQQTLVRHLSQAFTWKSTMVANTSIRVHLVWFIIFCLSCARRIS